MSAQAMPIREDAVVAAMVRRHPELTAREIQILQHAADGEDCVSLGQLLGLAAGTVKQMRHKAKLKLGADNITHAIAQALRRRIIS